MIRFYLLSVPLYVCTYSMKLGKHFIPSHSGLQFAEKLTCSGRPPFDPVLLYFRLTYQVLSTILSHLPTGHLDAWTTVSSRVLYCLLLLFVCILWPDLIRTPWYDILDPIAHWASFFICFRLILIPQWFRSGHVRTFTYYAQLRLLLLCSRESQAEDGRMWYDSSILPATLQTSYTYL